MADDMKLTFEIKNTTPVELLDLTQSLSGIADEYRKFITKAALPFDPDQVKLYVKEIRSGSIITELAALTPVLLLFMEHAANIVTYAEYLKVLYDYLTGKSNRPDDLEKQTLQNLSNIVEPIAKDNGSQLNIGAINFQGNVVLNYNLNSLEANAVQNTVRREIEQMKEPDTGVQKQALMYLYQARNDMTSKAGDKAIIERIYPGAVKTIFANEKLKARILLDEPNPFKKAFVIDVSVETINRVPKLYRVLDLYDVFDRD